LTPEQAKAQLLAIAAEPGVTSLIDRYPFRALAIALAAGFLFARTIGFWPMAGRGAMWLVERLVPLPARPKDTALEKLRARVRRMQ
jgi:hypothetical protein